MKRRDFIQSAVGLTGSLPFVAGADALAAPRPASSMDSPKDMTPWAVKSAFERSKSVIRIPKGVHHLYSGAGHKRHLYISNNDAAENAIAFPIIDRETVIVEGNGSTLICHGRVTPFALIKSKNVIVRDLTIDWQVPFHVEGDVLAVDPNGKWVDLYIPEEFSYRIEPDGSFVFAGEGFEQKGIKNLLEYDQERRESGFQVKDNFLKWRDGTYRQSYKVTEIGNRRIRIALGDKFVTTPTVKNRLLIMPPERLAPAFYVADCEGVSLQNVTIRHSGCMGVIAQTSKDISITDCEVAPDSNGERFVSTTVDATHFVNCSGVVSIKNCNFANHIDDAVNVHGIFLRVLRLLPDGRILAERSDRQQKGIETVRAGDKITLSDSVGVSVYHHSEVTAVNYPDDRLVELTLSSPVQGNVIEGDVINTISRQAALVVDGCSVARNRARGLLVSTLGPVTIQNNTFHTPGSAIRISGGVDFWYESGPTSSVVIANNIFDNCRYGVWGKAVIDVECVDAERGKVTEPFHGTIRIEDNDFIAYDPALVSAYRAQSILFNRNRIVRSTEYSGSSDAIAPITVEVVGRVITSDNVVNGFQFKKMVVEKA